MLLCGKTILLVNSFSLNGDWRLASPGRGTLWGDDPEVPGGFAVGRLGVTRGLSIAGDRRLHIPCATRERVARLEHVSLARFSRVSDYDVVSIPRRGQNQSSHRWGSYRRRRPCSTTGEHSISP